jgi:plasmid maintenance system antidote protein VapI
MNVPSRYDEDTEAAQRIARHLAVYMTKHDLNENRLAALLGVNRSTVNRLLSGERGIGLGLALRIARRLLIDPHELLLREPLSK